MLRVLNEGPILIKMDTAPVSGGLGQSEWLILKIEPKDMFNDEIGPCPEIILTNVVKHSLTMDLFCNQILCKKWPCYVTTSNKSLNNE